MPDQDRSGRGWQVVISNATRACLNRRLLLPAALFILVLGIGITSSIRMVQAQDGGTGAGQERIAQFVLEIDTRNLSERNFCLGQRVTLPVTLAVALANTTEDAYVGGVTVRSATVNASTQNSDIVQVGVRLSSPFDSPSAPYPALVDLDGLSAGTTTIEIDATVQGSIALYLDEAIGLPIGETRSFHASVPVRVLPCSLRIWTSSYWQTTIGAANVVLNATSTAWMDVDLTGRFESASQEDQTVKWFFAWNRPMGCLATNSRLSEESGVNMEGRITGNEMNLTLSFQPLSSARTLPTRCPGGFTETGSVPWLDNDPGGNQEGQAIRRDPRFTPESITKSFSIAGLRLYNRISRTRIPQRLERQGGSVYGWLTITVELLPSRNNP